MPRCLDCAADATVQIQAPGGGVIGWLCDECSEEGQRVGEAIRKKLADEVGRLIAQRTGEP